MGKEKSQNSKKAFWQAFILTIIVFVVGIFLGIVYEGNNLDKMNDYYVQSEIFLLDSLALNKVTEIEINNNSINCESLIRENIKFADRIYLEARSLEKYEESNKLTDSLKNLHKKYDILRTILWTNTLNIPNKCENNVSTIVYLYERNTEDLKKKATNNVFSKILFEIKEEKGGEIILIPISVDNNLASLNLLISEFNISEYPVLIIDNNNVISEVKSTNEIKKYIK